MADADLITAQKNRNQVLSAILMAFQSSFPVGNGNARLKSYTVATMPNPTSEGAGVMIYVSDASSGSIPAFSDGVAWRRVDDRTVVT